MPQGLQVWDASSNLILDTSHSLGRVLGTVTTGASNGNITDANLADGRPFYCILPVNAGYLTTPPKISVSGTTLSWTFTVSGSGSSCIVVYGVY